MLHLFAQAAAQATAIPADPVITISWQAAGTLGLGIGSAIVGASKLLISFLEKQSAQFAAEIRESREQFVAEVRAARTENRELTKTLLAVSRETTSAVNSLKIAFEATDRQADDMPHPNAHHD